MSEEFETKQCSFCNGELQKLGVLGNLLFSRCRDCGLEQKEKVSETSSELSPVEASSDLNECVGCGVRYAAAEDPDLCPDCHSSFLGRAAANTIQNERGLTMANNERAASDNAYPNGELTNLISQQRDDTSRWQNGENHSPNPNVDPASLHGDSSAPSVERISETSVDSGPTVERSVDSIVARVFSDSEDKLEGAKVLLQDGEFHVVGRVELDAEDGFLVEWRTGRKSIEKKANYELMLVSAAPAHIDPNDYDQRHGGPFDRGSADSYYWRSFSPHYYAGPTAQSEKISINDENSDEFKAYKAGYDWNEAYGDKKDFGERFDYDDDSDDDAEVEYDSDEK